MNTKVTTRRRLLASTIICGTLAATAAFAQAPAGNSDVEAVIVTGSLLRRSASEEPAGQAGWRFAAAHGRGGGARSGR